MFVIRLEGDLPDIGIGTAAVRSFCTSPGGYPAEAMEGWVAQVGRTDKVGKAARRATKRDAGFVIFTSIVMLLIQQCLHLKFPQPGTGKSSAKATKEASRAHACVAVAITIWGSWFGYRTWRLSSLATTIYGI